jgi:hypothetical protein
MAPRPRLAHHFSQSAASRNKAIEAQWVGALSGLGLDRQPMPTKALGKRLRVFRLSKAEHRGVEVIAGQRVREQRRQSNRRRGSNDCGRNQGARSVTAHRHSRTGYPEKLFGSISSGAWPAPRPERRPAVEAAILVGLGVVAGPPNIVAELKAPGSRLSASQEACHERMREARAAVGTATGLDEALAWQAGHGLPRGQASLRKAGETRAQGRRRSRC